jgi:hypothetical protein
MCQGTTWRWGWQPAKKKGEKKHKQRHEGEQKQQHDQTSCGQPAERKMKRHPRRTKNKNIIRGDGNGSLQKKKENEDIRDEQTKKTQHNKKSCHYNTWPHTRPQTERETTTYKLHFIKFILVFLFWPRLTRGR